MNLTPYNTEVYFSLLARYNEALWPTHVFIGVLFFSIIWLHFKIPDNFKYCFFILSGFWVFLGLVYYGQWLSELTWAGKWFMALSLLQAVLLMIIFLRFDKCENGEPHYISSILLGLAAFYPILSLLIGESIVFVEFIALSPIGTLILTFGLISRLKPLPSLVLGLIPLALSLFINLEALELEIKIHLVVLLAALLWILSLIKRPRTQT